MRWEAHLACTGYPYRVLVWKSKGLRSLHDLPMQAQRGSRGIAPAHSQPGTRRWSVVSTIISYFTVGKNLGPNVQEAEWVLLPSCCKSLYRLHYLGCQHGKLKEGNSLGRCGLESAG